MRREACIHPSENAVTQGPLKVRMVNLGLLDRFHLTGPLRHPCLSMWAPGVLKAMISHGFSAISGSSLPAVPGTPFPT